MEKTKETRIARDRYWPNRPEFIEDIDKAKRLLNYIYEPFGGMDELARYIRVEYAGVKSGGAMATSYIIRKELVDDVGFFDDTYDNVGGIHEDKDYHLRMEIHGRWKTAVIHDGFAHHFSMMTRRGKHWQGKAGDNWELTREKNWRKKYGTRTIETEL
jgi:GT2 family glycosyltransferase